MRRAREIVKISILLLTCSFWEASGASASRAPWGWPPVSGRAAGTAHPRWEGIERQMTDVTCGLASLATVLRHLGQPADEQTLGRLAGLPPGQPATLRHLVVAAERLGRPAYAVRTSWTLLQQYLETYAQPAVVLLRGTLPHFTAVAGMTAGVAYLADPSWGHLVLPRPAFEGRWTGVALLVAPKPPEDLPGEPDRPLRQALLRSQQRHRRLVALLSGGGWEAGGR